MKVKHKLHYIYLIMLIMLLLQGCGSKKYAGEQAEEIVRRGRSAIEEYVNSLPEDSHITSIGMLNGGKQGAPSFSADFPSHIVQASFSTGDKHYTALVNLEDGEIYSNYDYTDPNELIQRQLIKYLDESGFNGTYRVTGAFYSYAFVSHQVEIKKGDVKDVYVYIDNIPDLAPVKNADELMNASISGFDIEYESENDEVINPEILYRYLIDTGNYRKENMRGDNREYHIDGGREEQNYVNGEPSYYEVNIISEGAPDTMTCDMRRWDYKEENGFGYLYVGGVKSGSIKNINKEEFTEYTCPFTYNDNELTYLRDDSNPYEGHLYIKNPEWNEMVRICYRSVNKSPDEKTNDVVDRWELEAVNQDNLEALKSDSSDLYELYIKGTNDKCDFVDDKVTVNFK